MSPTEQRTPPPRRRRRRVLFIVLSVGLTVALLALCEVGLRMAGVAETVTYDDPLVGFSRVSPLFERDDAAGVYRTSRMRRGSFEEATFAAEKPADCFRIFCLGGSTVRGRPYTNATAFPRWIQLELAARDRSHTYEVVNCGGLSYASYRLTNVLVEVLRYEPDLVVFATGHNEFLEDRTYGDIKSRSRIRAWIEDRLHRLRLVRVVRQWAHLHGDATEDAMSEEGRDVLPDIVRPRLDQSGGYDSYHRDDAWTEGVVAHYEQSLRAMVALCREADVPVLLVSLGANLRDCPPFKSEHRPGLTEQQQAAWRQHFRRGRSLDNGNPTEALEEFSAAAVIDDEHALLCYLTARCHDRLGRTEDAAALYRRAKDCDVCPLRIRDDMTSRLHAVAEETQTPLVDVRKLIESLSPEGLPGDDWYMDHVHPSVRAHQSIAQAVVARLSEHVLLSRLAPWTNRARRRAYREYFATLDRFYFEHGGERVSWLARWAERQRLLDEMSPQAPAAHLRRGHRLWDLGLRHDARRHYEQALSADPTLLTRVFDRALELVQGGRSSAADDLLSSVEGFADDSESSARLAVLRSLATADAADGPVPDVAQNHLLPAAWHAEFSD